MRPCFFVKILFFIVLTKFYFMKCVSSSQGIWILHWIWILEQRGNKSSFLLRPFFDPISLFELLFQDFWSFFGTLGWCLKNFKNFWTFLIYRRRLSPNLKFVCFSQPENTFLTRVKSTHKRAIVREIILPD